MTPDVPGEDTATCHGEPVPHRDFEAFMAPGIEWINEPEFVSAFRELTGEQPMDRSEAAWTQPGASYPGFVNVSRGEETGQLRIMVRSPGSQTPQAVDIPIEDFDQLVADARMVRQAVERDMIAKQEANTGRPYPTARDPLMERTDPTVPDDHPDNDAYWERIADDKHAAQMADLEPEADRSGGAVAGDPLAQREDSSQLDGPDADRAAGLDPGAGDYDPVNQQFR